ncbi:MAG: efflux transporter outer membrane subunit [Thermoguttaceae bacterium]
MFRTARLCTDAMILTVLLLGISGCTCPRDYVKNGFKVGPNPCIPQGPTAPHWIDDADVRVCQNCAPVDCWWTVFGDPALDKLIACAASENLSLREAGCRIMEARAQLRITGGNLFPQTQNAVGWYTRNATSENSNFSNGVDHQFFNDWRLGFNLSWELDFWGRFRRAVTAAENTLGASCANYDQVMVTLLGDVASNYVQIRTLQERIRRVNVNAARQGKAVGDLDQFVKAGKARAKVDFNQALSTLKQTEARIPRLQWEMRQAADRLCVLLGMPPTDLERYLGVGPIPTAPPTVVVGIPAELLCRRPDVRRAQHLAIAQGEQIGIAEAELYPAFFINGTLGVESVKASNLFTSGSLDSYIGPVFQWNILNYGRIRNNVRMQDARFCALVAAYQETVLRANAEVEDGLSQFLRAQERAKLLDESVGASQKTVDIVETEKGAGLTNFIQVHEIEKDRVEQDDELVQAYGDIAQGLIQVYRALGGGWQAGAPVGGVPLASGVAPAAEMPAPADRPAQPAPAEGPQAPASAPPAAGAAPSAELP